MEAPISEEVARITHQNQHISNYTPKDKRFNLGLNPQAGGVKILGRFIPGREGAKRNQTWAFFHLSQVPHHIMESHNLNTQSFRHYKGKHSMIFRTFPFCYRSAMESQRQSQILIASILLRHLRYGVWPNNWVSLEGEARRQSFKSSSKWRKGTG